MKKRHIALALALAPMLALVSCDTTSSSTGTGGGSDVSSSGSGGETIVPAGEGFHVEAGIPDKKGDITEEAFLAFMTEVASAITGEEIPDPSLEDMPANFLPTLSKGGWTDALLDEIAPVLTSEPSPKKSDCTPDQSADHQTHPFYPFSQSVSSSQPSIHQATPAVACPAGQNISTPPELPLAPLKTFSQQTRLARVCPCPAGQPTPTAVTPLSPSPLSLNRATPNQPAAKCGSSAFAPSGLFPRIRHKIKCLFSYPAPTTQTTRLKSETTMSSLSLSPTSLDQSAAKCGSSAFAPSGQNLSATPPLPSAAPELSDHQTHTRRTPSSQPPSHPYRRRSKTSPPPPRLPPSPFLPTIYLTRKRCGNWALTPK